MSAPDSACWSGLNTPSLKHVKNEQGGIQQPSGLSSRSGPSGNSHGSQLLFDDLQTFSPIGASTNARLYLIQTPPQAEPSTVVWASPEPTWGKWPFHSFSYCVSILTERDARDVFVLGIEPLPPIYEYTLDGVLHLWLVVPDRSSLNGRMRLSEEQMWAAMEFYGRTNANTAANVDEAGNSDNRKDGAYANPDKTGEVLISCAQGLEVDTVALAVLLLAHHIHSNGRWRCRSECGARHSCSVSAYRASELIESDPGVSHTWRGLLEWQDVERVETVLQMI